MNTSFLYRWLIISSVLVYSGAIYFHLFYPTIFIDDAYIYLHIANNILDTSTAQFYPIADNGSLLASSPLRLLILIPATAFARLFTVTDLSFTTVRLTFIFSGFFTILLFLPFLPRFWRWAGVLFNGFASVATLTLWQMEGALLFWCLLTLAILWKYEPLSINTIRKLGYFSGLLILTRIEYGLITSFVLVIALLSKRGSWSTIFAYCLPLLLVGLSWILIATFLNVWFIPTSYLSKVITGQLDLFSADFGEMLPLYIDHYFFGNLFNLGDNLPWLFLGVVFYSFLLGWQSSFYRSILFGFILVTLLLFHSPGNYLWYYENYFVVFAMINFFIFLDSLLYQQKRYLLASCGLILIILFNSSGIVQRLIFIPNHYIEKTNIYNDIAQHHQEQGLFKFPEIPETYISMVEIGVVSYFSGKDVWIHDMGGLAQPGTLPGTKQSFLSYFYPAEMLVSAVAENQPLCQRIAPKPCLLHDAWAIQEKSKISTVHYYFPAYKIGLNPKSLP